MIEALHLLRERIAGAASAHLLEEMTRTFKERAGALEPFTVRERDRLAGRLPGRSGRGRALTPAFHVDEHGPSHIRGRCTFSRHHLGGNWVVHGGVIPLTFEDVLGRPTPAARTAHLRVDYRLLTPIGQEDPGGGRERAGAGTQAPADRAMDHGAP